MNPKAHRLPTHVRPQSYAVEISADPARNDFAGRIEMKLDVKSAAAEVEMHARDLEVQSAAIAQGGASTPVEVRVDTDRQVVRFVPKSPLQPGEATLTASFTGKLNPSMHGIYLASDGKSRMICTQCE